jgi:protein-tyrosine phosphatase
MPDPLSAWIRDRYGGKRAFLRYCTTRAGALTGRYGEYLDLDYGRVERLVFVCKGNICRSPYAEARARAMGHPSVSAGIEATPGSPADAVASRIAARRGLDLGHHCASRFDMALLQPSDLLLAFEPVHLAALLGKRQRIACQVTLLGLFGRAPYPYIHDPHGCPEAYFSSCFDRLDVALDALFRRLPPIGNTRRKCR